MARKRKRVMRGEKNVVNAVRDNNKASPMERLSKLRCYEED